MLILAVILLPDWIKDIGPLSTDESETQSTEFVSNVAQYLDNVPGQMTSTYLLLALGFALALRCGAVDLSVWAVAGAGGVATATLMSLGAPMPAAFAAAGVVGVAVGAIHGLAVVRWRLPSVLVTAATGIGLVLLLDLGLGGGAVEVPRGSFEALRNALPFPPLLLGRMLIVAGIYAAVMLVLLTADAVRRQVSRPDRQRELWLALAASGGLAGLAGACGLIDYPVASAPNFPIGDLRVVAAAVLAGGAMLGGRGRTMLMGLSLPLALLTATIWRQEVALLFYGIVEVNILILIGMAIVAHMAIDNALSWRQGSRWLAVMALAALVGGMAMLGASGRVADLAGRRAFELMALGLWLAGVVLLLVSRGQVRPTWTSRTGQRNLA
jgi:simple sugar transport system permease protein